MVLLCHGNRKGSSLMVAGIILELTIMLILIMVMTKDITEDSNDNCNK